MPVGDTYRFVADPDYHLYFVLTEPNPRGQVVIANLTTVHPWTVDRACILMPGDHPYVVHQSAIYYSEAGFTSPSRLAALVANGGAHANARASRALMVRIRAGAIASPFTPGNVRGCVGRCPWVP